MIPVSVIIPTYKPFDYLWECLDSFYIQTLEKSKFEVIIVLNGCNEPYNTQILNYIDCHKNVQWRYYQTDEPGVSNARNIGIDKAVGEYVVFVDDDDFVSSCYLEELLEKATPKIVSLCYPLSFKDGTSDYYKYYITEDYQENNKAICHFNKAKKYFSGPVYKMIHRNMIGDRRFDESFKNGEDSLFMFLISDRMGSVAFTSTNAIYYRRIRRGSAVKGKRRFKEILFNTIRLTLNYSIIYWKHPFKYNFKFYFTRIIAAIHGFLNQI